MASTPRVGSSRASAKARFGKSSAPRARRRMAKRRAGAARRDLWPGDSRVPLKARPRPGES